MDLLLLVLGWGRDEVKETSLLIIDPDLDLLLLTVLLQLGEELSRGEEEPGHGEVNVGDENGLERVTTVSDECEEESPGGGRGPWC